MPGVDLPHGHRIFTNFVKTTISQALNGPFQKFKKLKSLVWSALSFGKEQLTKVANVVLSS